MPSLPPKRGPPIDPAELRDVLTRGQAAAFATFEPSGRVMSPGQAGVPSTLYVVATLKFIGVGGIDLGATARAVAKLQLPNGAFPNFPYDPHGDPWVTALAVAVFRVTGEPSLAPYIARAEAYLQEHGGADTVADGLYRLNVNPLFIAMLGELDAERLPHIVADGLLLEPVWNALRTEVNVAFLWMGIAIAAILRRLRDPEGAAHPGWLASHERARALAVLAEFQNELGSFNATVFQTTIAAAAMYSLGLTPDDPPLQRAITWILNAKDRAAEGDPATWHGFHTSVWTTALTVRALLASGVPRTDPRVAGGLAWLVSAQIRKDLSPLVPTRPGAPRHGGWAFEAHNETVPDADDTAVVLGTLALSLQADGDDQLAPDLAAQVRDAVDRGEAYLRGMQNDDGGWPAFQQGLGSKPRGPILVEYPHFRPDHLLADLKLAYENRIVFGDPSTEDITGRTLFALGQLGYTVEAPQVASALAFLESQQCTAADLGDGPEHGDGGPWWSRWMTNYLSATGWILGGLAAVGADLDVPYVRRAKAWVAARQNPDGGWGELPDTYQHPERAGHGPSMPVVTGLVLCALIQSGEGDSEAVRRGIRYLLDTAPKEPGPWPENGMLHVFYRTDTFYEFVMARVYGPLEALGRYAAHQAGRAPAVSRGDVNAASIARSEADTPGPLPEVRAADGSWSAAGLEAMRTFGDPSADAVIRAIFDAGQAPAVGRLMGLLVRNDAPVPAGLPPVAAAWFDTTDTLPPWADLARIEHAQRLFSTAGWATAIGLFNAALPQCYAHAEGARALAATRGLEDAADRRILETAQFIFDVCSPGAFAPDGGAVRAAQKVRLMHATVRHLTLARASWDLTWGVPVNQTDEAYTLMSFGTVLLDAWKRMGLSFTAEDEAAWVHLWCVIGAVMGIEERLLPRSPADGRALWQAVAAAHWGPSDAGRALGRALYKNSGTYVPQLPGFDMSASLIRFFSGDRCADLLDIPPADAAEDFIRALTRLHPGVDPDHTSALGRTIRTLATRLMITIVRVKRGGKEAAFRIPPALLHDWGIGD